MRLQYEPAYTSARVERIRTQKRLSKAMQVAWTIAGFGVIILSCVDWNPYI